MGAPPTMGSAMTDEVAKLSANVPTIRMFFIRFVVFEFIFTIEFPKFFGTYICLRSVIEPGCIYLKKKARAPEGLFSSGLCNRSLFGELHFAPTWNLAMVRHRR
jgi:hypothetical protein